MFRPYINYRINHKISLKRTFLVDRWCNPICRMCMLAHKFSKLKRVWFAFATPYAQQKNFYVISLTRIRSLCSYKHFFSYSHHMGWNKSHLIHLLISSKHLILPYNFLSIFNSFWTADIVFRPYISYRINHKMSLKRTFLVDWWCIPIRRMRVLAHKFRELKPI